MNTIVREAEFNPYPGPRPFRRKDRDIFFGRDLETADLMALITGRRLSLFYAASGAGKSSLIQAKLIPMLEEERGFEVLPIGRVSGPPPRNIDKDKNIFVYHLEQRLAPPRPDADDSQSTAYLTTTLSEFLLGLAPSGRDAEGNACFEFRSSEAADNPEATIDGANAELKPRMLFIDQFEELFTTNLQAWEQREPFFVQLRQAMNDDPLLYVVLAMREDYIAYVEEFIHLLPELLTARYGMKPMGEKAALDAIELPVEKVRPYAAGVASKLVHNFRLVQTQAPDGAIMMEEGPYVEPVQLQVVCKQLWESIRRENKSQIDEADLQSVSKGKDLSTFVVEALADFYEAKLIEVRDEGGVDESMLRRWFGEELITKRGTRDILSEGDQETRGLSNQIVRLIEAKGLVRRETGSGGARYELVHDRFIEPIRRSNDAWHQVQVEKDPLLTRVEAWVKSNDIPARRDQNLLLPDFDALTEAEKYAETWHGLGSDELAVFVTASRQRLTYRARRQADEAEKQKKQAEAARSEAEAQTKEEKRQKRRFRRVAAAAAVMAGLAAVLALVAGLFWRDANIQRDIARANAKAAAWNMEVSDSYGFTATRAGMRADEKAQEAVSQRLADQAEDVLMAGNADLALALAVRASQVVTATDYIPAKSEAVLAQAVYASQTRAKLETGSPGYSIAYSTARQFALAGDADGNITFWNLDSSDVVTRTAHSGKVWSVAFSRDGDHALTAGDDGRVLYWDVANHTFIPLIGDFGDNVFSVAFLPDGNRALIGGSDGKLHLWDLEANRQVRELAGHDDWVYAVAVSPDGSQAVSGSEDQSMILWDLASGRLIRRFGGRDTEKGHRDWVRAVAFSPDGKTALSGSRNEVILWDLETGETIRDFRADDAMVYSLAFAPKDSSRFVAGGAGGITLWDVAGGLSLNNAPLADPSLPVRSVAFGDSPWTVVSAGLDGALQAWDLATGGVTAALGQTTGLSVSQPPQECGMTSDHTDYGPIQEGTRVILGRHREYDGNANWGDGMEQYVGRAATVTSLAGADGQGCPQVHVDIDGGSWDWRIRDLQIIGSGAASAPRSSVNSLAASSDGLYTLTGDAAGSLTLWDASLGRPLRTWQGHDAPVTAMVFLDDGMAATGAEDGSLRLWDVLNGQETGRWQPPDDDAAGSIIVGLAGRKPGSGATRVYAFTENGRFIAWLPTQGQTVVQPKQLPLKGLAITSVAFTGNGSQALLGLGDGTLRFWDSSNLQGVNDVSTARTGQTGNSEGQQSKRICADGNKVDALAYRMAASPEKALVACGGKINLVDIRLPTSMASGRDGRDERASSEVIREASLSKEVSAETMGQVHHLSFADNGTALVGAKTDLWRWRFDTKELQSLGASTQTSAPAKWVALTGNRAVTSDGYGLAIRDLTSGKALYLAQPGASVALTAEPGRALVSNDEGSITAWEWQAAGSAVTDTLTAGQGWPWTALAVAGEDRFVTASYTGTLTLWDAGTGDAISSSQVMTRPVSSLAVSADGRLAAVGAGDGSLHLWDFEAQSELPLLPAPASGPHTDAVLALAFDGNGKHLLSGGRDGRAILWDLAGRTATDLTQPGWAITSIALDRDGRHVWLGLEDGTIALSDVKTQLWQTLAIAHQGAIHSLALAPDGALALSGGADNSMALWDVETGAELARFEHSAPVLQTAFGRDSDGGRYALSSDASGIARVWRLAPPARQMVAWSLDHGRYIPKLDCELWDALDLTHPEQGCTEVSGGLLALGSASPAEQPVAAGETITPTQIAAAGTQMGFAPSGGSEAWQVQGGKGQALAFQVVPVRPVDNTPDSERAERGRLALRVELQPPDGAPPIVDPKFVVLSGDGYVLNVSSADGVSSGPYTLTLSSPSTLDAGAPARAEIANGERHLWSFPGKRGQFVRVDMTSADFDSYLELYGPDGVQAAANDDFNGRDSRIELYLSSDGPYTIVARPLSDGTAGSYQISLAQFDARPITLAQPEDGAFDTPTAWTFDGKAGQLLRVLLEPTDDPTILPALKLLGPDGSELARADNSGQHSALLPLVALPKDGIYGIVPSAQSPTGAYRLSLAAPETRTVRLEETVEEDLSNGIVWELTGAEGKVVTIRLDDGGDGIDPFLTVLGETGTVLAENDDGGGSYNSLVTLADPPAQLRIVPKALGGRTNGRYRLTITVDALSELGGSAQVIQRLDQLATSSSTQDNLTEALDLYQRARELGGADIPLQTLNRLCWFGSLNGLAGQVIDICEQLVRGAELTAPDRLHSYRDSRGLARALTGDIAGAIDDFRYAAETVGSSREEWVRRLEAEETVEVIFDANTLEALKNE